LPPLLFGEWISLSRVFCGIVRFVSEAPRRSIQDVRGDRALKCESAPTQDPHHPGPLLPTPSTPSPGEEGEQPERPSRVPLSRGGGWGGRERGRGEGLGRGRSQAKLTAALTTLFRNPP